MQTSLTYIFRQRIIHFSSSAPCCVLGEKKNDLKLFILLRIDFESCVYFSPSYWRALLLSSRFLWFFFSNEHQSTVHFLYSSMKSNFFYYSSLPFLCTVRMVPCDRTAPSAPYTRPTQRLLRPPPIQKLGAENHMLQLNIQCSWWWAYVPETCRAKNTSIKLPCCNKLAFQVISSYLSCILILLV